MSKNLFLTAALILAVFAPPRTSGQAVTATILGNVTDASGATVPGARVLAVEVRTGIGRNTETNQSGNYVFPSLPPGLYNVEVEHPGFRKAVRQEVSVAVNTASRVDLQLQPGEVSESITVMADAAVLQTDRADTGRKIETKQVQDMPLGFNRNFQGLLNLTPGVGRAFRPHSEFFNPQDSLSNNVNGQSRLANNVQLDGVDNNHRTGLLTAMIPPIEALATVDISTSNYDAELGRAGGAVTNVAFRSGTNDLHGSVFHFNRVSKLGARNVFAQTKAPTTFNLFGFTLGGPIVRNKTFFFGDYQGTRDRRGDVFRATIPTPAFRQGDLSASPTVIYDPLTGDANGRGRTPFVNRQIPLNRISPVSRRILDLVPDPTFGGLQTNFERATVRSKDLDSFDIKVDHNFTDRDRFSARYSFQRAEIEDPPLFGIAGGGGKGFAGTALQRTQNLALNYTRSFSPTLLAEFRAGVLRYRNDARNTDIDLRTADDLGISGVNVSAFTGGIPSVNINGFSNPMVGFSASLPWERAETNFNFVSNWTKLIGNHTIKWGADIRRLRDDLLQTQTFGPRGAFTFTPGPTGLNGDPQTSFGNSFASFLLDRPNSFGRDLPVIFPAFRQTALFFYGQDKWQVTPKLTLDLGLRWEIWPPATPGRRAGFSNFDASTNSLVIAGVGNNPSNLGRETFYTLFAPRIGIAYRVSPKTVIRTGYGISYIPFPDNSFAFNFPVRQNNAFNALNAFSPAGAMADGFPAPFIVDIPADGIIRNAPASNFDIIPLDYKEGYVQSYNFMVQHSLPKEFTLEAGYVGNVGRRVGAVRNINAGQILGGGAAGQPLFQQFGRTAVTNLRFASTNTSYNSLQVKLDRRFSGGFLLTTAYTYSRSIDFVNDNGGFFFQTFPELNRGRSDFDRTHMFVQSYLYQLPFGRNGRWLRQGPLGLILGDWQVNGIFTGQSGLPINFTFNSATLNTPGNGNRPNLNGKPAIVGRTGPGELFFDTSNFSAPAPNTIGGAGRNLLGGPSLLNLDFSVFRHFPISERFKGEFRFESFNFTNTPHFNNPNGELGNANFGQVVSAQQDQRQIQFGLKITF